MFLKPTINPTLEFPTASWVVTGPRWYQLAPTTHQFNQLETYYTM